MTERGTYHHGDLRHAMIEAAEAVLAERGVAGFTLRECARRAGVSPGAPAHHFGNVAGLLTEVARLGFDGLTAAMQAEAAAADDTASERLAAIARGYVNFALAYPDRFRMMFGRVELNQRDAAGRAAGARAYGVLTDTVAALLPPAEVEAGTRFAWSCVHGFATLVVDGKLGLDATDTAAFAAAVGDLAARMRHAVAP